MKSKHLRNILLMGLLVAPMVVACARPTVPVSIHGVNYSGVTFSYVVLDPKDSNNRGGGELVEPFAGGGTVCCFELPKTWRPGIVIEVHATHWLPGLPDKSPPEVKTKRILQVPPYSSGRVGELWVIRGADGAISILSTDFQPDHPRWPGNVKGWPVPSIAFRRERWELERKYEEQGVALYRLMLEELRTSPLERAKESWAYAAKNNPSSIKGFTGPDDAAYWARLKQRYEESLERSERLLRQVMDSKP